VLFVNRNMTAVETHRITGGDAVVFSAADHQREGPNQDSAALIPAGPGRAVLAVADGVGGQPEGSEASGVALAELHRSVERAIAEETSLRDAILTGFENANRVLTRNGSGGATTLAVAEIENECLRPFHVGDSLVAVVGQRGRRKLETLSHSPVGYAVEAGVLDEEEAMHHEERHLISNAVGFDGMRIEVGATVRIAARDTVLLATDGLLDNLFMHEILDLIRVGPLPRSGQVLADQCLARMRGQTGQPCKPDDVTFIAYRRSRRRAS
jgi:serine/threonine protein phosphatase PrpC